MEAWVLTSNQYDQLWEGFQVTALILGVAFLIGVLLSLVFGVGRLSDREWVRGAALAYVEFSRGISTIILLFIFAFAIPILLGVDQGSQLVLATIALGINMGGYGAEIVRGAIQSIPKGQTEATIALNLSPTQRLQHVILPQALRVIVPPMGNLTIEILKGTALVSLLGGVTELMKATANIRDQQLFAGSTQGVAALFLNVLLAYFILAQLINGAFRFWEWRLNKQYEGRGDGVPEADDLEDAEEVAG